MPFVICKTHGGAIAPHGCRHVAEDICERRRPESLVFVDLDGLLLKGWICGACEGVLKEHGLQRYLQQPGPVREYPPADQVEPMIDVLDLQPMCARCFEEIVRLER
jgi:hypothetical protein